MLEKLKQQIAGLEEKLEHNKSRANEIWPNLLIKEEAHTKILREWSGYQTEADRLHEQIEALKKLL